MIWHFLSGQFKHILLGNPMSSMKGLIYMNKQQATLIRVVFGALLAAMVFVVTLFRFPLLGSQVHFANAVCLLSGILLGPVWGGLAAGLGSALYDLSFYNTGIINLLITFISKFAMAWVCGMIVSGTEEKAPSLLRLVLACAAGALTYVALYMIKSGVYSVLETGNLWTQIIAKFPASIINAVAAIIAAPIFYHALRPALKSAGILAKLRKTRAAS